MLFCGLTVDLASLRDPLITQNSEQYGRVLLVYASTYLEPWVSVYLPTKAGESTLGLINQATAADFLDIEACLARNG